MITLIIILVFLAITITVVLCFLEKGEQKTSKYSQTIEQASSFFKENQSTMIELAGSRHYKVNKRFNFKIGDQVYVFKDTYNLYSSTAVKVVNAKGIKLGHIPKQYSKEAYLAIDEGFSFLAFIQGIDTSEPKYPYVTLKICKTKNEFPMPITKEMIIEMDNDELKRQQTEKIKSDTAYELCQQGIQAEGEKEINKAIDLYENAIRTESAPPHAYKRLVVIYRKRKDYDNEIRVLNSWLDHHKKSLIDNSVKQDIKDRLLKAYELKNKNN